mgnify:CR=1 FL=1
MKAMMPDTYRRGVSAQHAVKQTRAKGSDQEPKGGFNVCCHEFEELILAIGQRLSCGVTDGREKKRPAKHAGQGARG